MLTEHDRLPEQDWYQGPAPSHLSLPTGGVLKSKLPTGWKSPLVEPTMI
jgi:hypothetical protein